MQKEKKSTQKGACFEILLNDFVKNLTNMNHFKEKVLRGFEF